jgi:hypothetical protein
MDSEERMEIPGVVKNTGQNSARLDAVATNVFFYAYDGR